MHPPAGIIEGHMQFVPMMWGNAKKDAGFADKVLKLIDGGMNISYVLGFNEPDICTSTCPDPESLPAMRA